MENLLWAILVILVLGFGYVVYLFNRSKPKDASADQSFVMLQNQLNDMSKVLDAKLSEANRSMQNQFGQSVQVMKNITDHSTKMISGITEKLTSLDKTNQQVIGFSEQLTNLERVLTSQKQRGNLGEAGLKLVLENILPPSAYALQYKIDEGKVVDAVVKTKDGMIPVDAKFSLDNYNRVLAEKDKNVREQLEREFKRDLKSRIEETSKYIDTNKGTLDFAFMFIPAEAIYYDLLVNEVGAVKVNTSSLIDYAFREKRVIIVSPTTFAAYLHTVLQGLRALQIEEDAKFIRKNVENLQKHIRAYDEKMRKLGMHIGTAVNTFNDAHNEYAKIDKDVVRISGGHRAVDPMKLDGPKS